MLQRAVHRVEILKDELDVPANRIGQIIAGKRAIAGDTALRLGHWFGTDPQSWLNLQSQHDRALADRQSGDAIRKLETRASQEAPAEL